MQKLGVTSDLLWFNLKYAFPTFFLKLKLLLSLLIVQTILHLR